MCCQLGSAKLRSRHVHTRSTKRTPLRRHWYLAQALRTLLARWVCWNGITRGACLPCVHRRDHKEVNSRGNQQECDQGIQEQAVGDHGAIDREIECRKIRL